MLLENKDIKLRALEPEDLETLYKWENNTSLWIHGNTLSPYSKLALRQYIEDSLSSDIYQTKQLRMMVVAQEDNRVTGTVDIYDFDIRNQKAGVGILIDEKEQNKQYATQTIELITKYCFSFLGIHQLYAYSSVENTASIKVFEKCGFEKGGMLKNWIRTDSQYNDVFIYQRINS